MATRASVRRLEVGVAHGARVRQDVADVAHAGQIHDQALEAQTVAGVLAGTGAWVLCDPVPSGAHQFSGLSVLGGDGMEPRTRGFPRGAGRSGRSVVVGKRRVEFSTTLPN